MFKSIVVTLFPHKFMANITASFYSPSSFLVSWETMYPSMWSVVSDVCKKEPLQITKTMPYRIQVYLYDCVRLPEQKFIIRNEDLEIYNRCVLNVHTNCNNDVRCDYM